MLFLNVYVLCFAHKIVNKYCYDTEIQWAQTFASSPNQAFLIEIQFVYKDWCEHNKVYAKIEVLLLIWLVVSHFFLYMRSYQINIHSTVIFIIQFMNMNIAI